MSSHDASAEVAKATKVDQQFELSNQVVYNGLTSTIFVGAERSSRLLVAIKIVMKSRCDGDEESLAVSETLAHANIPSHHNVARFLAAEETSSAILLVTPYTPYGDLWSLVRYGKTYCEVEVRKCAAQIMNGLKHLHTVCNMVHGDIKPHNILLFRAGEQHVVKLCDFGLAQRFGSGDSKIPFQGLRGTSGWFAPEMLANVSYDSGIDIFATGLILFRMLAGYSPFDPPSNMRAPAEFDERYWCHTSPACRDFIARALSLDPASRITSTAACQHEWFQGPPPGEPTEEQLQHLRRFGPAPATNVLFWPPGEIPDLEQCCSYFGQNS